MISENAEWDRLYDNSASIPNGGDWPGRWVEPARAFRERIMAKGRGRLGQSYGPSGRNAYDLFQPEEQARGLVVYVHGGFWMESDRSFWSHLAAGPLAHGFAVAMPEYSLCPGVRIPTITREIAAAVTAAAAQVEGPVMLVGHSAGGHLVSRMTCIDSPLPEALRRRLARVMSISGLHDLRPLERTWRAEPLHLTPDEVTRESPALLRPLPGTRLTCWVGADETSEFRRQSALLANVWRGLGATTDLVEEPGRHHFDIVDGLTDPDHPLVRTLLS